MSNELTIANGRMFGRPGATAVHVDDGRIAGIGTGADLAVLDRDLLAEGASAIIGTISVATVIGGRVVHRSEGSA